jgi:hypothetical protein
MTIFTVSCYSPPGALSIKKGDKVKVVGCINDKNMRAETIEIIADNGAIFHCGIPEVKLRVDTKIGIVKRVVHTSESIEFDFEAIE